MTVVGHPGYEHPSIRPSDVPANVRLHIDGRRARAAERHDGRVRVRPTTWRWEDGPPAEAYWDFGSFDDYV